jgi:hypothetical protein
LQVSLQALVGLMQALAKTLERYQKNKKIPFIKEL